MKQQSEKRIKQRDVLFHKGLFYSFFFSSFLCGLLCGAHSVRYELGAILALRMLRLLCLLKERKVDPGVLHAFLCLAKASVRAKKRGEKLMKK